MDESLFFPTNIGAVLIHLVLEIMDDRHSNNIVDLIEANGEAWFITDDYVWRLPGFRLDKWGEIVSRGRNDLYIKANL